MNVCQQKKFNWNQEVPDRVKNGNDKVAWKTATTT